jgi:hypothetical protein
MRTINIVAVAATVLACPAAADPPKYKRNVNVSVDVKLSDRVKPRQHTSAPPAVPIGPDGILLIEERTQPIRREQERVLERLIRETPDDDPDKPDIMFRLAEHYAKQLRFYRLQSIAPTMPSSRPLRGR